MRALQKLVRCGNAYHYTIPKLFCEWAGWLPGESFIIEALEDQSVRIRRPLPNEFQPKHTKALRLDVEMPLPK